MRAIDVKIFRSLSVLIRKEFLQLIRGNGSILIGAVLPIVLILIMGCGISLDVKNVPVAVVLEDAAPPAQDAVSFLNGSEYFSPHYVTNFKDARELMSDKKANGVVAIESCIWFNDANSSTWYFVPGLMMLIMTLVGIFLTALVMAREWERGTLEAIFVTPVKIFEILLSKMITYCESVC